MEKNNNQSENKKNKKAHRLGCFALLLTGILWMWICGVFDTSDAPTKSEPILTDLSATVSFDGSQFIISNLDNFNWMNVELEVNGALFKSGYKLKAGTMVAGTVYTVGALQFAKPDGTRLNPFTVKPQSFEIQCDLPEGKSGWYSATW